MGRHKCTFQWWNKWSSTHQLPRNWSEVIVLNIGQGQGEDFKWYIMVTGFCPKAVESHWRFSSAGLTGWKQSFPRLVLAGRVGWLDSVWNADTHKLSTTGTPFSLIFLSTVYETRILLVSSRCIFFLFIFGVPALNHTLVGCFFSETEVVLALGKLWKLGVNQDISTYKL